jgi:hypothetical protein
MIKKKDPARAWPGKSPMTYKDKNMHKIDISFLELGKTFCPNKVNYLFMVVRTQ